MTIVDKKAPAQEIPAQKAAGQNVAPSPKSHKEAILNRMKVLFDMLAN